MAPTSDSTGHAPLAGIRVLDFTQNLPGPYATELLASLGAEVIKIEPPKGDSARAIGSFFDLVNGGKKSIVVDLKDAAARASIAKLLPSTDVVVEGFRPGVMAEFGFDAASVRAAHPRVVYCSISAYGQEGPYRSRPAHDINLQALVGACDLGRDEDDRPRGGALPIADLSSSMTAALAIVAALHARHATGEGRTIDVALSDTVASWAHVWGEGLTPARLPLAEALPQAAKSAAKRSRSPLVEKIASSLADPRLREMADALGASVRRSDRFRAFERVRLHALPHYGTFRCKDGAYICIGIVDEDKFWRALAESLGLAAFSRIPLAGRFLLAPPLRSLVSAAIARKTRAEWMATLDLEAVPVSPVLHFAEALDDPQLASRRSGRASPVVPPPLAGRAEGRAPKLGEHTDGVLGAAAAITSREE